MLNINSIITEEDIFKYILKREDYDVRKTLEIGVMFLDRIKENIFSNEWAVFYEVLKSSNKQHIPLTYDFFHEIVYQNLDVLIDLPNVHLFDDEKKMTNKEKKDSLLDTMLVLYDELYMLDVEDEDYLRSSMELYLQAWAKEAYEKVAYNGVEILNDGFKPKGSRRIYKGIEDYIQYKNSAEEYVTSILNDDAELLAVDIDTNIDTIEEVNNKMEDDQVLTPVARTGIDAFDNEVNNLHKGEILVPQAGTGVGKTRFSVQTSYLGMVDYKSNVLYISMEQTAKKILPMFVSRHIANQPDYTNLANMTDKDIIYSTYEPENQYIIDEAYEKIVEDKENIGRLKITGRSLMSDELESYMNKVWDEGFHFDILVLDYIGLMEVSKGETKYDAITNTINMIKSKCKNFKGEGFLAIIPNQLSPDVEKALAQGKKEEVTKAGGTGSQYISRASDNVVTLHQSNNMKDNNEMEMIASKVRLGESIPDMVLDVDLGKCVYLGKDEEDFDDNDY